jgi:hypothetical protein
VRSRSRSKNEIHAVLMRRLKGRPPMSDLFGVKGRKWLRELELAVEEAETVQAALRHIEFLDAEIAEVERLIAREALRSADARRLMTVPGVNVICAASFLAAIGDIRRFRSSRQLVAYLGLDPKVRQSTSEPARSGRISKRGSASARSALIEAAWSVVRQPGPLHAFYERIRARRGHGKAVVAAACKLAILFWCLLSRGEDYALKGANTRVAQGGGRLAAGGIPQPHRPVVAGAGEPAAVGRKRHRAHPVGVAFQGGGRLAAGGIPQPHRLVGAGAGEPAAVGRKRHRVHSEGVAFQGGVRGAQSRPARWVTRWDREPATHGRRA